MSQSSGRILVTGGAGFIGSHLVDRLIERGDEIVVLDDLNGFYDPAAKRRNIQLHLNNPRFHFVEGDIRDRASLDRAFSRGPFVAVVHLAAMAGVRPSLERPALYMDVNVTGTQLLLDRLIAAEKQTRLIFGSSSSVYGRRSGESFKETDRVDQPLSPYGASKAAAEMLCHVAHYTAGLPVVCLRFFTVFGPRQRPDLAIHKFCRLIDEGKPIEIFGDGTSKRDYTYVADIVDGIIRALGYDLPGFDIINLGRCDPVVLTDMVHSLEEALGKKAIIVNSPEQVGDMPYTYADVEKARTLLGYSPSVSFAEGINRFVAWYLDERAAKARH